MFKSTMSPFSQRNAAELGEQLTTGSEQPTIWPFELMASARLCPLTVIVPRSVGVVVPFGQITAWLITSPAKSAQPTVSPASLIPYVAP